MGLIDALALPRIMLPLPGGPVGALGLKLARINPGPGLFELNELCLGLLARIHMIELTLALGEEPPRVHNERGSSPSSFFREPLSVHETTPVPE